MCATKIARHVRMAMGTLFVVLFTLWSEYASCEPNVQPGSVACADASPSDLSDQNKTKGYVSAVPVTRVLPSDGDARIIFNRPLNHQSPQRFRVLELGAKAQPSVLSVEAPPDKLAGYTAADSVLLHVNISSVQLFPLWHKRDFIVVECTDGKLSSWGKVQAYVSSPYAALLCIPVALLVYALGIMSVYQSREETKGKLVEKYPAVFGAKKFEKFDFFNPIQLAANAFNQGSVQKLQVLMFSFLIGWLVLSLVLRTGTLTDMSATVVGLLGISGIGAAVSQVTYMSKTRLDFQNWAWLQTNEIIKTPDARGPQWKDLVLTNREFDVYKLQTIIFSLAVAAALVVGGATDLATFEIPSAMLGVLGLSQVVFVGGILVRPPATDDLDKVLVSLRSAADSYAEALARKTDIGPDGKLMTTIAADETVAANARRQYEQLVDQVVPMIESTLEVEVNKENLLDAPLTGAQKIAKNAATQQLRAI